MRRSSLRKHLGERIIVSTRDDQSYRGVLDEVAHDAIYLTAVEHLGPNDAVEVIGRMWLPNDNRSGVQLLSRSSG